MITPRKAVAKMHPYHPPLEGRREFLRLDFNENVRGCSPKVIEALRRIDAHEIATYPEYTRFHERLAEFLGLTPAHVLPTNASDEGILTVFQTYLDSGDELLLPEPTFAMFRFYGELLGLKIKPILYNKDLSFPGPQLVKAITSKTKAVVLVNPNNPTGSRIDRSVILKVLKKMGKRLVLLDEAYVEFSNETAIDLIKSNKNLIILRTFSKSFGMAGIRLGMVISAPENIKNMAKAHSPYSISGITVKLAMAALDDLWSVTQYARETSKAKEILREALSKLKIRTFPSHANFLLADFGARSKRVEGELRKRGILVRDRSADPLLKGFLRITVGPVEETKRVIAALNEIEDKHG